MGGSKPASRRVLVAVALVVLVVAAIVGGFAVREASREVVAHRGTGGGTTGGGGAGCGDRGGRDCRLTMTPVGRKGSTDRRILFSGSPRAAPRKARLPRTQPSSARRSYLAEVLPDRRILFFGDSYVAGVEDPHGVEWVGRLAVRAAEANLPLTVYNLGVRRETSGDVAARWRSEFASRRADEARYGLVFSFGANDAVREENEGRVPAEESVSNLARILREAHALELSVFVVGPPPVPLERGHAEQQVIELEKLYGDLCTSIGVPFPAVANPLAGFRIWREEALAFDGAHPARAVTTSWHSSCSTPVGSPGSAISSQAESPTMRPARRRVSCKPPPRRSADSSSARAVGTSRTPKPLERSSKRH